MIRHFKIYFIIAACITGISLTECYAQYTGHKSLIQKINKLSSDYPALCSVKSVGKTPGGRDVMVLSLGTGDKDNKPAIAIAGGIDGSYLFTRELAMGFVENLLRESATPEIRKLIDKITFYVFPDVNPDASEQYFATLEYERLINDRNTDDDRDFINGEDPYEDLNGDGFITKIRVTDSAGTYVESTDDKRIMVQADLAKGQKGMFVVYSEGFDNDRDGLFNEDGPGGVDFNKNFTYNYEEYGINAGLHAVSEPESKAVADFLYDHFNIYAVICFGPQDNLGQPPPRGGERPSPAPQQAQPEQPPQQMRQTGERRITSVMKTDETLLKLVSEKYHEITGLRGAPSVKTSPGNFADWVYYHYGRYCFTTPGWWFPPADKERNIEAAFLKYAEDNKIENVFISWTEIKHPDFPGKKVEVGGIKPFVMTTPPADKTEEFITKNYKFIIAVAEMHPELEFIDTKVENVGNDIFRITLKVHNKGLFATCAEVGNNNQWTRIARITLEPSKDQTVLSGQKVQRMQRLESNSTSEYSWLISGKGRVTVTAGALNTGAASTIFELK
ncbi:MAG: M14 family metallopeptidase [Bacteroidales bacterium]